MLMKNQNNRPMCDVTRDPQTPPLFANCHIFSDSSLPAAWRTVCTAVKHL